MKSFCHQKNTFYVIVKYYLWEILTLKILKNDRFNYKDNIFFTLITFLLLNIFIFYIISKYK